VTQTPVLVKVSSGAAKGEAVTVQGRYLGGPATGRIRLGADENGQGGYLIPTASVTSWTDSEIVFSVPATSPAGGSWLFIEVNGRQSTGLPFSVSAQ
jgi:IPT/TIG domain